VFKTLTAHKDVSKEKVKIKEYLSLDYLECVHVWITKINYIDSYFVARLGGAADFFIPKSEDPKHLYVSSLLKH
jgi:hypothetical protein